MLKLLGVIKGVFLIMVFVALFSCSKEFSPKKEMRNKLYKLNLNNTTKGIKNDWTLKLYSKNRFANKESIVGVHWVLTDSTLSILDDHLVTNFKVDYGGEFMRTLSFSFDLQNVSTDCCSFDIIADVKYLSSNKLILIVRSFKEKSLVRCTDYDLESLIGIYYFER